MAHLSITTDDLTITLEGDAALYSFADSGFVNLLAYLYDFHVSAKVVSLSVKRVPKQKEEDPTLLDCTVECEGKPGPGRRKASVVVKVGSRNEKARHPDLGSDIIRDDEVPDLPASFGPQERKWFMEAMKQVQVLTHQWKLSSLTVAKRV